MEHPRQHRRTGTLAAAVALSLGLSPAAAVADTEVHGGAGTASEARHVGEEPLGMLQVSVRVDGLSCPFCAYGLEKRLRRVDRVAGLEIRVSEGVAVVTPEPGSSLDLASLEEAVRKGGFTPRRITLRARGRLVNFGGVPALELPGGVLLLLADDGRTRALLETVAGDGVVIVAEGEAVRQQQAGHAGHPYTLTLRSLEVT